ncbi:MAG: hypothetical protein EXR75_07365 [Myxococcales bacterium]|nr:hypothetical protein [Myxococcales bacterium]
MNFADVELRLYGAAAALTVDPRLLRRIIKAHRGAAGVVPHARCYTLFRGELATTGLLPELGRPLEELPDPVILLARPSPRQFKAGDETALFTLLWRAIFHCRVHLALDQKFRDGALSPAVLRARIDQLGQVEFDEIRSILRQDDLVLPPYDDREIYIEFAAHFLELQRFAPELVRTTFPGLAEPARVIALLAEDVDADALFESGRPLEVALAAPPASSGTTRAGYSTLVLHAELDAHKDVPVSQRLARSLLVSAAAARTRGNDAGAILDAARATKVLDEEPRREAKALLDEALKSLDARLTAALAPPENAKNRGSDLSFGPLLRIVAGVAADAGRYAPEARVILTLQRAALAHEKLEQVVDVAGYLLARGKKRAVRELPALRELRVLQALESVRTLAKRARVGVGNRTLLAKLIDEACSRAHENFRSVSRPKLRHLFDDAGIGADNDPERVARDKLIEELLDELVTHGFLSFGSLRDALSRNQLKLGDLTSARELWSGDPLVRADLAFDATFDGAYHASDAYVRWLQKLSSVPFGTTIGRFVTLFFVLPLGGAFIALEAAKHLLVPLARKAGLGTFDPMTTGAFVVTTAVVFGIIHSRAFRSTLSELFSLLVSVVAFAAVTAPRAALARPGVRRWFARPKVRFALRSLIVPALLGLAVWQFAPLHAHRPWLRGAVALFAAILTSAVLTTRLGTLLEEVFFDQLAPAWRTVSRQFFHGIVSLVVRFFEALLDLFERGLFRIEERLHFREGESRLAIVWKGAAGLVFACVAYVARLYVTLLLEPEVNPLKHFPVVTVAHKLMLPVTPAMFAFFTAALSPLGALVGGTLAAVTVFLVPSIFGFFAWELKENFKLYRATRPARLLPASIGAHGETLRGLLVPGFHMGTLPNAYERLRHAAERESHAAFTRKLLGKDLSGEGAMRSLGDFRAALRDVEERVRRFVARELLGLLGNAQRWPHGPLALERIELSSNRIRVHLACPALGPTPCVLSFEEQSGHVVAGFADPGFVLELVRRGGDGERLFENALAGVYHRAEVAFVREQLSLAVVGDATYFIADDGLVVWPCDDFRTELRYPLRDRYTEAVVPEVRGAPLEVPVPVIDTRHILFAEQRVGWAAWVAAWTAASHPTASLPRLSTGTSLLPPSAPASGELAAT